MTDKQDLGLEEQTKTEVKVDENTIYGVLILQLIDNYLPDGDLNVINPSTSPGSLSFMDKENPEDPLLSISKFGVTVGLNQKQVNFIQSQLDNRIYKIRLFRFIKAERFFGLNSIDYSDLEAIAIASNLSGKAHEVFVENDVRFMDGGR